MFGSHNVDVWRCYKEKYFFQETRIALIPLVPNIEVLSSWFKKENTKDLIIELF